MGADSVHVQAQYMGEDRRSGHDPAVSKRFTTTDIIVISMFGALGIMVGMLGNILHGASMIVPFFGPFILHTLLPGIVLFACIATVRKVGTATLLCLITALVAMPLAGAPLFILSYIAYGLVLDGATLVLGRRIWTRPGMVFAAVLWGAVGLYMLYYVVMRLQGIEFPVWVFLASLPVNIAFAVPAALYGLTLGNRAQAALVG
ncbi:hypothetical protein E2N92_12390 [Methanofollis formosanus]|uniref:ECF transporter S component n=1 Tax=Methanofollis formosanus TaxID=299308 RepID=A0A8G1A401_9EURY|nr:MptD family putative ECF transporter S component [Methanofollis formosanus]QYZ80170.1 hypothetical protein E2N92_12390 [Methanofollis formosanus]